MMTNEMIARVAPSVFAEGGHESTSDRYSYISTIKIIEEMRQSGYEVVKAHQTRAKDANHTKHVVRFRQPYTQLVLGDSHPEIVLVNSHDGTSCYQLSAGVFRLVCSNGLVVSESTIADFRIRHKGNILGQVMDGVQLIQQQLPKLIETVDKWRQIKLSNDSAVLYTIKALELKYGEGKATTPLVKSALKLRRWADNENNLWTVFNRVQENLIQGGVRGIRPLRAVDKVNNLNRDLWDLTHQFSLAA